MQFGNTSVQICPADNLYVGSQLTAIDGEINIHGVIMSGNNDRWSFPYACPSQGIKIGSISLNILIILNEFRILLHNLINNLSLFQGLCRCTPDTAATQYENRSIGGVINTVNGEDLIIFFELFSRAGKHEHSCGIDSSLWLRYFKSASLPKSNNCYAGFFSQIALNEGFSLKWCSHCSCFSDEKLIESSDNICPHTHSERSSR